MHRWIGSSGPCGLYTCVSLWCDRSTKITFISISSGSIWNCAYKKARFVWSGDPSGNEWLNATLFRIRNLLRNPTPSHSQPPVWKFFRSLTICRGRYCLYLYSGKRNWSSSIWEWVKSNIARTSWNPIISASVFWIYNQKWKNSNISIFSLNSKGYHSENL